MNSNQVAVLGIFGLAALGVLYFAVNTTPDGNFVPEYESEAQFDGVNIKAGITLGPLMDTSHLWDPDGNPRDKNPPCGVIATRHRYPSVPGGNVSTVIHRGWSALTQDAPAGNDWFNAPPSVAVL